MSDHGLNHLSIWEDAQLEDRIGSLSDIIWWMFGFRAASQDLDEVDGLQGSHIRALTEMRIVLLREEHSRKVRQEETA